MNKYIKREDAQTVISDAKRVTKSEDAWEMARRLGYAVAAIPAADVVARTEDTVEVVRCDECKRGGYCGLRRVRRDIAFCSLGIRMDGDAHV